MSFRVQAEYLIRHHIHSETFELYFQTTVLTAACTRTQIIKIFTHGHSSQCVIPLPFTSSVLNIYFTDGHLTLYCSAISFNLHIPPQVRDGNHFIPQDSFSTSDLTYFTTQNNQQDKNLTFRGPCIVSIFLLIYFRDATLCSLFISGKLLYMFWVVSLPIIRSTYNCIYSIWYLLTVMDKNKLLVICI